MWAEVHVAMSDPVGDHDSERMLGTSDDGFVDVDSEKSTGLSGLKTTGNWSFFSGFGRAGAIFATGAWWSGSSQYYGEISIAPVFTAVRGFGEKGRCRSSLKVRNLRWTKQSADQPRGTCFHVKFQSRRPYILGKTRTREYGSLDVLDVAEVLALVRHRPNEHIHFNCLSVQQDYCNTTEGLYNADMLWDDYEKAISLLLLFSR